MKNLAVALRYAEAVYAEAKEANVSGPFVNELNYMSKLLDTNKEFNILITSASLSASEQLAVMESLYKLSKISRLAYAFLVILVRKHRLNLLKSIIEAVNKIVHQERSEVEAHVIYASEVNDSIKNELTAQLAKITGKNVILRETIDPALLGGLSVVVGSTLYDASIRGKLSAMKALIKK